MQPVLLGFASGVLIVGVGALMYSHRQQKQQQQQMHKAEIEHELPKGLADAEIPIRDDSVMSSRPQQYAKVVPGYRFSYH